MTKVSSFEEVFAQMRALPQPVGIMLFGVDCPLKDMVYQECMRLEQTPWHVHAMLHQPSQLAELRERWKQDIRRDFCNEQRFGEWQRVLVTMDSLSSADHEERREIMTMLREAGAKSVVGIYVRLAEGIRVKVLNILAPRDIVVLEQLTKNPPNGDGLDGFVTIEHNQREVADFGEWFDQRTAAKVAAQ